MAVSRRLRFEVMRRDNFRCHYCGKQGGEDETELQVDHVIPVTLGGNDEPSNLVTACGPCNAGKSATPADASIVADVDAKAAQWAKAMQIAAERRTTELADERARGDAFKAAWNRWTTSSGEHMPMPGNWRSDISFFMGHGLDDTFLSDAVDITAGNRSVKWDNCWRYFYGICRKELERRQAIAAELLAQSEASQDGDFEFPLMEFFQIYLNELATAVGMTEEMRKLADWAMWDGLPLAAKAWDHGHPDYADVVDEDGDPLGRHAVAEEIFTSCLAPTMWRIHELRIAPANDAGQA